MYKAGSVNRPLLDLTVIIASYNTRDLLRSCLRSVYQYTEGISFEVICVDDASPDGSADMVRRCFADILVRNLEHVSMSVTTMRACVWREAGTLATWIATPC